MKIQRKGAERAKGYEDNESKRWKTWMLWGSTLLVSSR